MTILFNVFEIFRNADLEEEDRVCVIMETEGQHLEAEILHAIETKSFTADAEIEIIPASTADTPLLNYRQEEYRLVE